MDFFLWFHVDTPSTKVQPAVETVKLLAGQFLVQLGGGFHFCRKAIIPQTVGEDEQIFDLRMFWTIGLLKNHLNIVTRCFSEQHDPLKKTHYGRPPECRNFFQPLKKTTQFWFNDGVFSPIFSYQRWKTSCCSFSST